MHYGVRVLDLQHRPVFRRFLMKFIPATWNAYAFHLHIYERCGVCAPLTCLSLEVSSHLFSTDTLTRAHTHWRTRKGAAMAKECTPDCFLPPSLRDLGLWGNQLSSLPATVFAGLSALTWVDIHRRACFNMKWHLHRVLEVCVWADMHSTCMCIMCVDRIEMCFSC